MLLLVVPSKRERRTCSDARSRLRRAVSAVRASLGFAGGRRRALTGNQPFDEVQGVSRRIVTETRDLTRSARPRFESGLPEFEKRGLAGSWLLGARHVEAARPLGAAWPLLLPEGLVYFLLVAVPSASVTRCEPCAILPERPVDETARILRWPLRSASRLLLLASFTFSVFETPGARL